MKVRIEAYDRLIIIDLSETITIEDVKQLDAELPKLCKEALAVVVGFNRAQIDNNMFAAILLLRERHKIPKTKLFFASRTLKGADTPSKSEALRKINTADADRVIEIFVATKQQKKLDEAFEKERLSISNILRASFGQAEEQTPLSDAEIQAFEHQFHERIKRLQYLYKVLGSEISNLHKQRSSMGAAGNAEEAEFDLNRVRQDAIKTLKELKVL